MARSAQRPEPSAERVSGSQTIRRALAVLAELRSATPDAGVSEIARAVALPASTVHRILRTLHSAGYVVQDAAGERYRLGREAFLLGRAAAHTLGFDAAAPYLDELAQLTGESVNLVVRDGDHGLVVLRVDSEQPLRFTQQIGAQIPLYCTSSGKVLLAWSPDPSAAVAALGPLVRHTSTTIVSNRRLIDELGRIRSAGFAINRGERIAGVHGLAAPVCLDDGVASAALAVQGPQTRLPDDRLRELAPSVVAAAASVSGVLPPVRG